MKRTTYIFIEPPRFGIDGNCSNNYFHIYVGEAVSGRCKFWRR